MRVVYFYFYDRCMFVACLLVVCSLWWYCVFRLGLICVVCMWFGCLWSLGGFCGLVFSRVGFCMFEVWEACT